MSKMEKGSGLNGRNYVCDKCKHCDEYQRTSDKDLSCRNCKCEIIYHLYDADEELDVKQMICCFSRFRMMKKQKSGLMMTLMNRNCTYVLYYLRNIFLLLD